MRCRAMFLLALVLNTTAAAGGEDLSVTMTTKGEWVNRFEPLEFVLSRPLVSTERLALFVGTADVTGLCGMRRDTLTYSPGAVALPSGPSGVTIYLVAEGVWRQVGNFPLNVLTSAGLERMQVAPAFTISEKGQPAEDHAPEAAGAPRKTFQELNGMMTLRAGAARGGVDLNAGFDLIGVSFRQEALRFGEKREDASKIDLASYLVEVRTGRTAFSAGQVSQGRERHLLSGFTSRGISATAAIGPYLDVSGAILNATNIVGWDNFIGLRDPDHRIYSGTLGLEALPGAPGTVRIEGSYVSGSQLPLGSFNRSLINDAEKSDGGSLRLILSDPGRHVTVDAGFAKTRFTNPADPLLAQHMTLVPVEPVTRQARYADVTWNVFQNSTLFNAFSGRLSLTLRHERVDPLYRAVGAATRSDILQNTFELHGGAGPLQCDLTHMQSEDNLAEIPSILKTKTRQTGASVLITPSALTALRAVLPAWLPSLSYALNRTHQFGTGVPANSNMTPARVPDQVTTTHMIGVDWPLFGARVGYRAAFTGQDNRQPGRENADLFNHTHTVSFFCSPLTRLTVNLDGSLESTENTELGLTIRGRRFAATLTGQLPAELSASMTSSLFSSTALNGSGEQLQGSVSLDVSRAFDLTSRFDFSARGQVFVRFFWNDSRTVNNVFNLNAAARSWVLNTGLALNIL